jgi:hypothetical protein
VLASAAMSIPEVCGDGAALFPTGDDGALAAAIERVLQGGPEVERQRARGRARASQFSWARCAEGVVACYERAIAVARERAQGGNRARPTLPDELERVLRIVAAAPFSEGRDLAAWKERCSHAEAHLRAVEASRAELLAKLQALERAAGHAVTPPPPPVPDLPPIDARPRWSWRRRWGKIKAGLLRRVR